MIGTPCTVDTVGGALMPILYILLAPFSSVAHKLTLPLFVRACSGTALAKRGYHPPLTIPLQYRDASSVLTCPFVRYSG